MRLLRTSSCCFCANLRTGGLMIGFLSLFGSISNAGLLGLHGQVGSSWTTGFTCGTYSLNLFFFIAKLFFKFFPLRIILVIGLLAWGTWIYGIHKVSRFMIHSFEHRNLKIYILSYCAISNLNFIFISLYRDERVGCYQQ